MRLRIRTTDEVGKRLLGLRPVLRAQVVATVLEAHAQRIDLAELLAMRRELVRLGTLLNQSLRVSKGTLTNTAAVEQAAAIVTDLTRK